MTENEAIAKFKRTSVLWESATNTEMVESVKIAIQALEEIQQYREIGTLEKCRTAVERMKPKRPVEYEDKYYGCPKCGNILMEKWEKYPHIRKAKTEALPCCLSCLQVIDWSE